MTEPLTLEEMKAAQDTPRSLEEMRAEHAVSTWRPPSAEEEAIREDWAAPAVMMAGIAGTAIAGPVAGVAAGTAAVGAELVAAGAAIGAREIHPSLEFPVELGTGLLLGFTAEKWLAEGLTKAASSITKIPQFWSKEFAVATQKGQLPEAFSDTYADVIKGMDMGDVKDVEKMRNVLKGDFHQVRMEQVGKQLEKVKIGETATGGSPETVIQDLVKKKTLTDVDYKRLAAAAQTEAIQEYTPIFEKLRTDAVAKSATEQWQSHKMKDVFDDIIKHGGVSRKKHEFASSDLEKLFFKKHPNLKVTKAVSADLVKVAKDHGYVNLDDMVHDIYATSNMTGFKRVAAGELSTEFNRIYKDEILLRIANKEGDYLFRVHKVKSVGEEKLIAKRAKEAMSRASNKLPAKEVVKEVESLKESMSKLLKILQKESVKADKSKARRLRKVYEERLADYEAAVKVKKDMGLINTRLKHVRGLHGGYQDQVNKLLAPLFNDTPPKLDQTMFQFLEGKYLDEFSIGADILLNRYDALLKTFPFSKKTFMDLTYAQAKDLDEFVKAAQFVSRNERFITEGVDEFLATAIVKEITSSAETTIPKIKLFQSRVTGSQLEELSKGPLKRIEAARKSVADAMNGGLAELKRIEAICYQLDGFKSFGRAWKSIFNKAVMAEVTKGQIGKHVFKRYKGLFDDHAVATGVKATKYWTATSGSLAGHTLSKEVALMIALNSKHTDNMTAMLKGLKVSEADVTKFLDTALNKHDMKLMEDILDMFETDIFPLVAKTYKEKTGLTFQKVKGGRYFHIVPDSRYSKQKKIVEDLFLSPVERRKQIEQHFTELRKGGVKAINLSFRSMTQHLSDVVHYATHWGALNDIQKLTRNPEFQETVEKVMGKEINAQFQPWLDNLARPTRTKVDRLSAKFRKNVTYAALAAVPVIAAKQVLSFITAMPKMGYKNSMVAIKRYLRNPVATRGAIRNASPEIANRAKTWNRDAIEHMSEVSALRGESLRDRLGWSLIHFVDAFTAEATWYGGYLKGLDKYNGSGNMAVNYANKVTRGTQPASASKDVPKVMRSGEIKRWITMFYSYWSVFHGQVAEVLNKGLSGHLTPAQVTGTLAWMCIAPVAAQQLAKGAFNTLTGREQEEEIAQDLTKGSASNFIAGIPGVRDLSSAIIMDYPYQITPMIHIPKSIVGTLGAAKKLVDEDVEWTKYDAESIANFISSFTLVPSKSMITLVEGGLRLYEGESEDITELFVRPPYEKGE